MKGKASPPMLHDSTFTNWESLNISDNPIKKAIISDWENLISSNQKEEANHKFLSEHAGFFFYDIIQDTVVISKMKFGADFVSDFVICRDKGSDGFEYELIELERPDIPLFTKYNKISGRLVQAIQQIQNWKIWLLKYSGSIKNQFPSSRFDIDGFLNLKFTIIMSRKELISESEYKQRNHLSRDLGISIRSFDYLTDKLKKAIFSNTGPFYGEKDYVTGQQFREFSNPFFKAYTDLQWREMIRLKRFDNANMITSNISHLLEFRTYNTERLKQFYDYQRTMIK